MINGKSYEIGIAHVIFGGYSSVIAGEEIFEYTLETYGADEDEEDTVEYDLSYFLKRKFD